LTRNAAREVLDRFSRYNVNDFDTLSSDDIKSIADEYIKSEYIITNFFGNGGYISRPYLVIETSEDSNIQSSVQLENMRNYFRAHSHGHTYT
jgi:hypothetical protein